jgi:HAD superfamily hydrolase (TIGR01509 family)
MIDTVLFNLDGTLRDWPSAITQAISELRSDRPNALSENLGNDLNTRLEAAIKQQLFMLQKDQIVARRHYWIDVDPLPTWRAALPELEPKALDMLVTRFRTLLDAVPFADVHPALEQLRENYALGVLTNSPRPESILQRLGFTQYFDAIVTVFGGTKKPAAAAFELALRKLGSEPATTVYVGNSLHIDIQGALSAGLMPIWIDRFSDSYPLPDGAHRIEKLTELPDLLAKLSD